MKLYPSQCRAARALLNVTQDDLARRLGVSRISIAHFETGKRVLSDELTRKIVLIFKQEGVGLLPADESGGVCVYFITPGRTS